MRDEKEERKKQARSNKQTRQSNTAHPRQSLFLEKMSCPGGTRTHDTLYSRQSALPTELPRQFSWLGPNLTSHSTPDEQANHQLSMKEKAGVMKPPMTPNTKPSIYMFYMHMYIHDMIVHVHVRKCTWIFNWCVHCTCTVHVHVYDTCLCVSTIDQHSV